jgi:DNA-binding NtrC family response regulator
MTTPADMAEAPTRVLVVDDEPAIVNALRRHLVRLGHEVLRAGSAVEALETLDREGNVDLVLSDQQMPGMNGIAMMEAVRRRFPDVIRVLVSAQCDIQSASDAINDGLISRFVLKPWREEELETVVTLALRDGRLLRQTRAALAEVERLDAEMRGAPEDAVAASRRVVPSLRRLLEAHERRIAWGA